MAGGLHFTRTLQQPLNDILGQHPPIAVTEFVTTEDNTSLATGNACNALFASAAIVAHQEQGHTSTSLNPAHV